MKNILKCFKSILLQYYKKHTVKDLNSKTLEEINYFILKYFILISFE